MNLTQYLAVNLEFVLNKKSVWTINIPQLLFILEIWDRARVEEVSLWWGEILYDFSIKWFY